MIGSIQAEVIKTAKRISTWILTALLCGLLATLTYVLLFVIIKFSPSSLSNGLPPGVTPQDLEKVLYPPQFLREVLGNLNGLGSVIVIILGVLSVGSEYGWGTVKTVFTQKPGRLTTLAGKVITLALMLLLIDLLLIATGAASSFAVVTIDGHQANWPAAFDIVKAILASWLILGMWTAFGLLLAVIFRQSALAIGLGIAYGFVVEGLIFGIFGQAQGLKPVEKWFPGANATALIQSFGTASLGRTPRIQPLVDATQASLVMLIFIAVFLAVAAILTRMRDVTN